MRLTQFALCRLASVALFQGTSAASGSDLSSRPGLLFSSGEDSSLTGRCSSLARVASDCADCCLQCVQK